MSNVAIVFRNGNGHTAHLAQTVVDGAASIAGTIAESYPVDSLDETGWADLAVEDWLDSPVLSAVTFTASQMLKTPSLKTKVQNAGYLLSGAF